MGSTQGLVLTLAFLLISDGISGGQLLTPGAAACPAPTLGLWGFDPNLLEKLLRAALASLKNWREQRSYHGNHPKFKRLKQQFNISKILFFFSPLKNTHSYTNPIVPH